MFYTPDYNLENYFNLNTSRDPSVSLTGWMANFNLPVVESTVSELV